MRIFSRLFALILALLLLVPVSVSVSAAEDSESTIVWMLRNYLWYGEDAQEDIEATLAELSREDPRKGELWRGIMDSWDYCNTQLELSDSVLPDGLPQDDSLCIVILGFELNRDGTMKQELIDRLEVGLASARKYPNAYVAVTGGGTADVPKITEAGQMAAWLKEHGLSPDRLIVEAGSLSTVQNAQKVTVILNESFPQVKNLAVVTSDYHVRMGAVYFATASHCAVYASDAAPLKLVGCAANTTTNAQWGPYAQVEGICALTGITMY